MPSGFDSRSSSGQRGIRSVLVGHRTQEPADRRHAHRGVDRRRRRPRTAVLLRPAHGDAGRPAGEEHAAGDLGEHGEDVGEVLAGLGVHGRGEAAAHRADGREGVVDVVVLHDEGRGAEALREERAGVGEHGLGRRRQHDGRPGAGPLCRLARDDLDAVVRGEPGESVGEGRRDPVGEHRHRGGLPDGRGDALGEAGARGHEHDARVGAELPGPEGERRGEAARELVGARVERRGRDQHGVHGAELAVERDGVGPRRREVEQGAAAVQ